jgi:pimeloyl-ACP methyl ester carboxylesterase
MGFTQVDILGFSIGSFVAHQIALVRPAIVRRLVLASSAPKGAVGMHGWAPEVIAAVGTPKTPGPHFWERADLPHVARQTVPRAPQHCCTAHRR